MQLDHINISAPAHLIELEKQFLCELFSLKVGFRPTLASDGYWLYHQDNAFFHLVISDSHVNHSTPGYLDHVAFKLEGLNEFVEKLQAMNVEFQTQTQPQISITQIFLFSPAGIRLELVFRNETLQ